MTQFALLRATSLRARHALAVLVLLALAGCGGGGSAPSAASVKHPWIHPPGASDPKAIVLPPFLVYRVTAARVAEAVAELDKEPYIQLSPSTASYYTGTQVQVPAEMRPFLIRGLTAGKSEIHVVQSLYGLWVKVAGSDLGHPQPQPLVVMVDPTPNDIFVTVEAQAPAKP